MRSFVGVLIASFTLSCSPSSPADGGDAGSRLDSSTRGDSAAESSRDGSSDTVQDIAPAMDTTACTPRDVTDIAVVPDAPTLTLALGMPGTESFAIVGRCANGLTTSISSGGTWSTMDATLGSIDAVSGVYTANATAGGAVVVSVVYTGAGGTVLQAHTTLTIAVHASDVASGVPSGAPAMFSSPMPYDATNSVVLDYPLDQAEVPQNVAAPDVQWEGGAQGDVYRVEFAKPHFVYDAFVLNTGTGFTFDELPTPAVWHAIAQSDPTAAVRIEVDRLDAAHNVAYAGQPVQIQFASASLAGRIYYWDLDDGRIEKIDDTDTAPVATPLIPNPPPPDPAVGGTPQPCVACHTVSHDGRYMSAEMWQAADPSAVFDLTADLTTNPAPTVYPVNANSTRWLFSSFSPDGTRLIANDQTFLFLVDPTSGSTIMPTSGTLPASQAAHPAWSPDGNTIAFITNIDMTWAVDFSNGDLATFAALGNDSFGTPSILVSGSSLSSSVETGTVCAYPSWSPDSHLLAFQHGLYSRSDGESATTPRSGALYVIDPAGGSPIRLDRANGSSTHNFFPNFSPFEQGGFYWLVFFSRRDYGNTQAGTKGQNRRQLWVTAIDTTLTAGQDPSHVPYWLPGQSVTTDNMSAYWAPTPCRSNGASCGVSSECCSNRCVAGDGGSSCQPPPPGMCRQQGQTCGANSDCCVTPGAPMPLCLANVCSAPPG